MKKHLYLIILVVLSTISSVRANVGDTTWVASFKGQFTHYGAYDTSLAFPDGSKTYRKIYMIFTLGQYNCPSGSQYCHQWDYDVENYIMTRGGDTLEMARLITPYATSGTPGFGSNWKQHYIFDVTDYYHLLKDTATVRINYSGYSWGFTGDVKFAFIEGTPERNVLGYNKLWDKSYTYGKMANVIDSNVKPVTNTAPAGTRSADMKVIITGHGSDQTSGCCEFDNTGVGHTYNVVANGNTVAQTNMNINCGMSEIYPQGGTWVYARAGNWCPGGLVSMSQYHLTGVSSGSYSADLDFDDSYDGASSYGIYKISGSVFYYDSINHSLDASINDIIAPTNFEWYKRENPRVSIPVVKVRNTGSTTITSLLIQYGVKDSTPVQYIWTGSLAPLTDTIISLPAVPALTNLSLASASGQHQFVAQIVTVNGQQDNDASNNTLTSTFNVAPTWPYRILVTMTTSAINSGGNFGGSPSDADWVITDENSNVVASRSNLNCSTTYKDTLVLNSSSFYTLTVSTSQCLGLHACELDGQSGYTAGSFSVKDFSNNRTLALNNDVASGSYHDDFGCSFVQYFTTSGQCSGTTPPTVVRVGDTLIAPSGYASYQWYYNSVAIHGATHSTYGITHNNGNYTVKVTDGNACSNTSANFIILNLGVSDLSDLSSVSISPNPTRNMFNIHVGGELIGAPYTLTDMMGRKILDGQIQTEITPVSIATLTSGVYLLNIGNQSRQSFKIVKD